MALENAFLQKVKHYEQIARLGGGKFEVNRNGNGQLLNIYTESSPESSHEYSFAYDQLGRLESSTTSTKILYPSNNGDLYSNTATQYYKYDGFNQLSYIGSENFYVEIYNHPNGKVAETIIYKEGKMLRRFEYTYNDLGLRTSSVGYNKENEKEFTLEFEYRFF